MLIILLHGCKVLPQTVSATEKETVENYKCVSRICLEVEYTSVPCGLQITCLLAFFTKYCCAIDSPQCYFAFF